ncbi:manganese efflux pump [Lederbergia sp. NSJ-179]|uniref:manganese efflux pump n=1 Tax=Lederbergia sp. NSJ-179 TaxID=2931402 RepID=UPI001FD2E5D6|nr:manganese efflux pump [Lederbergia sp. NSJ-179]MCJ7842029.1 manganese efflux pump [Lederbergia sp. NSJ-179]
MSTWLIIALLTISSSIDNLGVGLSYGIRGIRISTYSNCIIALICFLFSVVGIYFGIWIAHILHGGLPTILGAVILAIIGIRIILLAKPTNSPKTTYSLNKSVGLQDSSYIGTGESIILGVALSANALTNGVGAGLLGISPILISFLAAAGSFFAIWAGVTWGFKLMNVRIGRFTLGEFGTFISGILLIFVAVLFFL